MIFRVNCYIVFNISWHARRVNLNDFLIQVLFMLKLFTNDVLRVLLFHFACVISLLPQLLYLCFLDIFGFLQTVGRTPWTGDQLAAKLPPAQDNRNTNKTQTYNSTSSGIRTHDPSLRKHFVPHCSVPWNLISIITILSFVSI
jgi:hypothetical protein